MGNRCGDIEGEQRPPLNAISPSYDLSEDTFKAVKGQYLRYPDKFPYVLSQMNEKNIKFVDQYFNCLTNQEKVLGDQFYAFHNVLNVTWKRPQELFKTNSLKVTDRIKGQNGQKVQSLYRTLDWIMQQPKLVKQIFRIEQLAKQGLILVYLPYYGSQSHPIEIVIDNYLPTFNNSYVVPIPPHSTVGMLFLQKALAKLLGSYQALRSKSGREIFEIVVGIPVVLQNLGINDDEVSILSKLYYPQYKIATIQQELESKHSQYIKINATCTTNVSIGIWQIEKTQKFNELAKHGEIIMELIKRDKNTGSYSRVSYASKLWENKTILRAGSPEQESLKNFSGRQFLVLQVGDYYLHIYSQSDKPSVAANIIIYSEHEVSLLFRKENTQLNEIKRTMVLNTFNQRAAKSNKPLQEFAECYNIRSKFIWDGYRGILCLICSNKVPRSTVRIEILPQYRRKIKFEDNGDFEMQMDVFNGGRIVSFIKLSEGDIGSFYRITPLSIPNPL